MERVFVELEKELDIELSVNITKCNILLRDPLHCVPALDDFVTLNGKKIKVVNILKYLGIYLSSDIDRRSTVSNRIRSAYRFFYALSPFFTENRLSMDLLLQLYCNIIVPTVMYGLKVVTLTKKNRMSLRRMENFMVLKLRDLARDPPFTHYSIILRGRSIIRQCRVHRLKYWTRRPDGHILERAMNYRIAGKLKMSRTFKWMDAIFWLIKFLSLIPSVYHISTFYA